MSPSPHPRQRPALGRALRVLGWALGCAAAVAGFYDARSLNADYALPAEGVSHVPVSEQVFYLWYAICGSLAAICLAMLGTELGVARLLRRGESLAFARPGRWIAGIAVLVFTASYLFRRLVLRGQPVADDESTYLFIARTLLAGRFTNPVPEDAAFFENQFVIINEYGWHGKYPIGHPLVLAIGEAVGAVDAVMPCIAGLGVWLTFLVGRRLFDDRVALIGASLLLLSPQFVWTSATLLSQPTLGLAMLAGTLALVRAPDGPSPRDAWLAGCSFGFGILVRPLPGALFCAVAALQLLVLARRGAAPTSHEARVAAFGLGVAPWIALFAAVNYAQSGSAFTSGYHVYHGGVRVLDNAEGQVVNSVVGALLRENFWLLGWTFALLPLPWVRPQRGGLMFWGFLVAELAYRVIAPKTVVAVTGPIYLAEVVPLLTLAVADGLTRIGRFFREHPVRPSVVGLAATLAAAAMFVPATLGALATGAATRAVVYDALEATGAERALVFADATVHPRNRVTWANYPDNPSPDLDDRWLFVRVPRGPDVRSRILDFWRRRFPERRAFLFALGSDGRPRFEELGK